MTFTKGDLIYVPQAVSLYQSGDRGPLRFSITSQPKVGLFIRYVTQSQAEVVLSCGSWLVDLNKIYLEDNGRRNAG